MAQGPSDTILVAIRITLRIRESKVRNPDPPHRRRFVLSECISCFIVRIVIIVGYELSLIYAGCGWVCVSARYTVKRIGPNMPRIAFDET